MMRSLALSKLIIHACQMSAWKEFWVWYQQSFWMGSSAWFGVLALSLFFDRLTLGTSHLWLIFPFQTRIKVSIVRYFQVRHYITKVRTNRSATQKSASFREAIDDRVSIYHRPVQNVWPYKGSTWVLTCTPKEVLWRSKGCFPWSGCVDIGYAPPAEAWFVCCVRVVSGVFLPKLFVLTHFLNLTPRNLTDTGWVMESYTIWRKAPC
jgi:hypothetical protein